jgi:hypothetical protein
MNIHNRKSELEVLIEIGPKVVGYGASRRVLVNSDDATIKQLPHKIELIKLVNYAIMCFVSL